MSQAEERPFDGCGKCFVGVRRLSRKSDATWSPARQRDNVLSAVAGVGGHIIEWADDWEVSGATNRWSVRSLGRGFGVRRVRTPGSLALPSIGSGEASSTA